MNINVFFEGEDRDVSRVGSVSKSVTATKIVGREYTAFRNRLSTTVSGKSTCLRHLLEHQET